MAVRVKICGVTRAEDAQLAAQLGADMIGLNFYAKSPRSVSLERAREIRAATGAAVSLVGVFVNAPRKFIEHTIREAGIDMVQLHGDETPQFSAGWRVPVIRALRLKAGDASGAIARVAADYVLLDTFHPRLYGGSGQSRSLGELRGLDLGRVFISGGLNPDNVAEAAALCPYGLDSASGVESAPGIKDPQKLRRFIENAKSSG